MFRLLILKGVYTIGIFADCPRDGSICLDRSIAAAVSTNIVDLSSQDMVNSADFRSHGYPWSDVPVHWDALDKVMQTFRDAQSPETRPGARNQPRQVSH